MHRHHAPLEAQARLRNTNARALQVMQLHCWLERQGKPRTTLDGLMPQGQAGLYRGGHARQASPATGFYGLV